MNQKIGAHEVVIEGDVITLITRGTFTLADIKLFLPIAEAHQEQFGYRLVLHDLTAAEGLTAEARRYTAQRLREAQLKGHLPMASASFGSGLVARAMMALFFTMIRLVTQGSHSHYIANSELAARAFLAEQRQRFLAERRS